MKTTQLEEKRQLVKKIKYNTTIELLTGLHIGGSKDEVEIGGIDCPVIKLIYKDNQPYIPGSSLKGKMRCLLEQVHGVNLGESKVINELFGLAEDNIPSRLIIRDAMVQPDSIISLKNCTNLEMPYTEGKWENVIHRVTGKAEHPRQIERVPAGVKFDVEFIVNIWKTYDPIEKVWNIDDETKLLQMLKDGLNLIENDYLGGNGSRGYGQVKFGELLEVELSADKNWKAQ